MSLIGDANRRRLLENSQGASYPAGTMAFQPGDRAKAFLLERGMMRGFWSIPDGRQATFTFVHPGALVGASAILTKMPPVFIQVMKDSELTILDLTVARDLASSQIEVLRAISLSLAQRVNDFRQLVAVRSLGSLKQRLAFDLLERACQCQLVDGMLGARASHQDLADSIGTSREVVSRALKQLRVARIVETTPRFVRVIRPEGLAAIVHVFNT